MYKHKQQGLDNLFMKFSGVIVVNVFNKHQALIPMHRLEKAQHN